MTGEQRVANAGWSWGRLPAQLLAFVPPCMALALVAVVAWAADKGFDIHDEGAYLLEYRYASASDATQYARIVSTVAGGVEANIVTLRLIRLALTVGSALVLFAGVRSWWSTTAEGASRVSHTESLALLGVIVCGALASYAIYPQTLSYNSMTNAVVVAGAGLVIGSLGGERGSRRGFARFVATAVVVGAVAMAGLLVKFPAGLGLLALFAWSLAAGPRETRWRDVAAGAASALGGVLVGYGAFVAAVVPAKSWATGVAGAASSRHMWHHLRKLATEYLADAWLVLRSVPLEYAVPIGTVAIGIPWMRRPSDEAARVRRARWVIGLVIAGVVLSVAFNGHYLAGRTHQREAGWPPFVLLLLLGVLALAFGALRTHRRESWFGTSASKSGLLVPMILLVTPLIGAIGTTNPLSQHVVQHLAPWAALCWVFAARVGARSRLTWLEAGVSAALALLWSAQTLNGLVFDPYQLHGTTLLQQTKSTRLPRLRGLQLDPASHAFLEGVEAALRSDSRFGRGAPILALNDLPGVVYAVGGRSPGATWYFRWTPERNHALIAALSDHERRTAFVLIGGGRGHKVPDLLRAASLRFPEGYRQLGTIPNPYSGGELRVFGPLR